MKTREKILKLLRKRGLAVNDTILDALDAFLFEVQEQVPGAPGDDDAEEQADEELEEDDADDDDEIDDDEEDQAEGEADDQEEDAAGTGKDLAIDADEEAELFGGTAAAAGRGAGASAPGKKATKGPELDADENEEDDADDAERTLIRQITCPHCGESIPVVLDLSGGDQDDIQDCEVCCSPMRIAYTVSQGALRDFSVEAS